MGAREKGKRETSLQHINTNANSASSHFPTRRFTFYTGAFMARVVTTPGGATAVASPALTCTTSTRTWSVLPTSNIILPPHLEPLIQAGQRALLQEPRYLLALNQIV